MLVPYGVVMSETSSWKGALLQKKKGMETSDSRKSI